MARSSLLGIDPAAAEPAGRDKASLGPSDSSDSGSDVAGIDSDDDDTDPGLPVDVALRDDQLAPLTLGESLAASEGGTGVRDGADIGVDRVFTPGQPDSEFDDDLPAAMLLDGAEVGPDENDEDEEYAEGVEGVGGVEGVEGVGAEEEPSSGGRRRGRRAPDEPASEEALPGAGDLAGHRPGRDD